MARFASFTIAVAGVLAAAAPANFGGLRSLVPFQDLAPIGRLPELPLLQRSAEHDEKHLSKAEAKQTVLDLLQQVTGTMETLFPNITSAVASNGTLEDIHLMIQQASANDSAWLKDRGLWTQHREDKLRNESQDVYDIVRETIEMFPSRQAAAEVLDRELDIFLEYFRLWMLMEHLHHGPHGPKTGLSDLSDESKAADVSDHLHKRHHGPRVGGPHAAVDSEAAAVKRINSVFPNAFDAIAHAIEAGNKTASAHLLAQAAETLQAEFRSVPHHGCDFTAFAELDHEINTVVVLYGIGIGAILEQSESADQSNGQAAAHVRDFFAHIEKKGKKFTVSSEQHDSQDEHNDATTTLAKDFRCAVKGFFHELKVQGVFRDVESFLHAMKAGLHAMKADMSTEPST